MSRNQIFATMVLLLSACIVDNPYARGTGATGPGETSTGDGDGDPSGDGDGDPSGDGDGDGDGDPSGDGDGDPSGDGDGDPSGDGDGDPVCSRKQWTYNFNGDSWNSVALDVAWTGANAPPCEFEIWATTYLEPWDQLLVFSSNGNYYRKVNGSWEAPQPIGQRFAAMNGIGIDSVVNIPPVDDTTSGLVFVSLPDAYLYRITESGNVTPSDIVALEDELPPGPPQSSSIRRWALVLANPEKWGMAEWWVSWQGFDNGKVYRQDGAFDWQSWPENSSPLFSGPADPSPSTIEAAWGNYDLSRAYFIAP